MLLLLSEVQMSVSLILSNKSLPFRLPNDEGDGNDDDVRGGGTDKPSRTQFMTFIHDAVVSQSSTTTTITSSRYSDLLSLPRP